LPAGALILAPNSKEGVFVFLIATSNLSALQVQSLEPVSSKPSLNKIDAARRARRRTLSRSARSLRPAAAAASRAGLGRAESSHPAAGGETHALDLTSSTFFPAFLLQSTLRSAKLNGWTRQVVSLSILKVAYFLSLLFCL